MSESFLVRFKVTGFKKLKNLEIDDIGHFNLIVGDNNVGKTTLLEALLANREPERFLFSLYDIAKHIRRIFTGRGHFLSSYFPSNSDAFHKANIRFELAFKDVSEVIQLVKEGNDYHYLFEGNTINEQKKWNVDWTFNSEENFNFKNPYIPFGPLYHAELARQYSSYIQTVASKKRNLLEALKSIINRVKNIEIVYDGSQPLIFIEEEGKDFLNALGTYGDGTIKFFRILLSLYSNQQYNRLMIDEIDTGIHHSRLEGFFKALLEVSDTTQQQIFATTHSKECIEKYILALKSSGMQDHARIIRLADTLSGIKAYTMRFDEFENAILADSEIR